MNGSGAWGGIAGGEFKAGDGLESYLGRWLLLEAAGGDVEAEDNLATSRQVRSPVSSWARS